MMMNPGRSILAALGGFLLFQVLTQMLETTSVAVVAGGSLADEASYFAVRNRPGLLVTKLGYTAAAALLSGYLSAKIAVVHEMRHTMAAAALVTAILVWEFTASEYAHYTPVWMRVALVAITGPIMLVGGWIRTSAGLPLPPDTSQEGPRS
jgi:hypothetical protein